MPSVLMLAAEHGGLPGGKVGGIGDVIAQLPGALVAAGIETAVVVPSYGVYQNIPASQLSATLDVAFAGSMQRIELYQLPALDVLAGATCWVVHHPLFGTPPGQIYHHDPDDSPFATDANLYALFCAATFELLVANALPMPDVVHLHDWHTATFALLCRAYNGPRNPSLAQLPMVYTVHNLALQGVRPLSGHPSSLSAWFPDLPVPLEKVVDPRYPTCYNPMRAGILLADRVHVVSPTYAREVLLPNVPALSRHGGEGLEADLVLRAETGDLLGILNGCDYPNQPTLHNHVQQRVTLLSAMKQQLAKWIAEHETLRSSDYLAKDTLKQVSEQLSGDPQAHMLVTSVGRITHQKVGLLLAQVDAEETTLLDALLAALDGKGSLILLGSGDHQLEAQLIEHAARHSNFLFLRGFSEPLAEHLYRAGDLFLMPSLFEPCGISQLHAMREGQPCLVHAVGGLNDTVTMDTGFVFDGEDLPTKIQGALEAFATAQREHSNSVRWAQRRKLAAANRFTWTAAAASYIKNLYPMP